MNNNFFFHSKGFRIIVYGAVTLIVLLIIFQAGVFVGSVKTRFSYGLGDNYYRTFGGSGRSGFGMMGMMRGFGLEGAYGVSGTVVSVNLPTLVVSDRDGAEKVVRADANTIVRYFREDVSSSDIKVGDVVVVIGEPNDASEVEAKLIRIMPSLPGVVTSSSTPSR